MVVARSAKYMIVVQQEEMIMPSYPSIKSIQDPIERTRVVERLLALRAQLDRDIPAKTATETLLLAT